MHMCVLAQQRKRPHFVDGVQEILFVGNLAPRANCKHACSTHAGSDLHTHTRASTTHRLQCTLTLCRHPYYWGTAEPTHARAFAFAFSFDTAAYAHQQLPADVLFGVHGTRIDFENLSPALQRKRQKNMHHGIARRVIRTHTHTPPDRARQTQFYGQHGQDAQAPGQVYPDDWLPSEPTHTHTHVAIPSERSAECWTDATTADVP